MVSPASPVKKKPVELSSVDDDEDLAPLDVQRSLSVPAAKPEAWAMKRQMHYHEKLDHDQQFIILFYACVWVCQNPQNLFTPSQKVSLLKVTIETLQYLLKLTSVKHLCHVAKDKEAFLTLLVTVLSINEKDLLQQYKSLLEMMKTPPSLERKKKEDAEKTKSD